MRRKFKIIFPIVIIFLLVFFRISSIGAKKSGRRPTYFRYNVLDKVSYLETPVNYTLKEVLNYSSRFTLLKQGENRNLTKLLSDKDNLLWLKIEFQVPEELKNNNKEIGLFIGRLRSSAELYLNNKFIRKYGNIPPRAMSCGFISQYYMFDKNDIDYNGLNTIYIQVWTGPWGALSRNIFLGEQADIYTTAERNSFFSSKFTITFACISFFISILYLLLSLVLRKYNEHKKYFTFALTNLFTFNFLLIFFIGEISWIKPPFISFLTVIKFSLCYGAFLTLYFASEFIISYLGYELSKRKKILRIILLIIPTLVGLSMPDYKAFTNVFPYLILIELTQFIFSTHLVIKDLFDKKKQFNVFHIMQGFTPTLVALILDLVLHTFCKIDDIPYLTLYGWQITIYIFLWQLINQFRDMYIHNLKLKTQLQDFNANLESVVALRTHELSEANYVLSRGLETVSHVQRNFLPPAKNMFRGWDISVHYQPLDNDVSGDLYDYYTTDSTLDGLGIFDVSGHGIPAGLMTILAKGIISQHFLNGLAQESSISEILEEINDTYIKEKVNVENYITGLLFHFSDFNKNNICSVELANAGHPYPILYNAEKNTITELKYENPDKQYGIIGVQGLEVSFPPISFRMGTDDIIVCFTDGLTEATNNNHEDFSKNRLINIIKENKEKTAEEISQKILECFNSFTENTVLSDDITFIVLKRTNPDEFIEEI